MTNNTISNSVSANLNSNRKGLKAMLNNRDADKYIVKGAYESAPADYDINDSFNAKDKVYVYDENGDLGIMFTNNVEPNCFGISIRSNRERFDRHFMQADDNYTHEEIVVFEDEAGTKFISTDLLFRHQYDNHELGTFYKRRYIRMDIAFADGYCGARYVEHLGIYYIEWVREKIQMTKDFRRNTIRQIQAERAA
jgi:hypothetical protein